MRLLCLMLVSLLVVSCGKTEKKSRTTGYKGEAKNNPFLAAQRYLEKQGEDVSSGHGLSHFDDHTAMIFLPPSSVNTVGRAKRLMKWVKSGGHLVVMLEGGSIGGNDFLVNPSDPIDFDIEVERPGIDYILEELEVESKKWAHVSSDEEAEEEADEDVAETDEDEKLSIEKWEELAESDRVLLGSEVSEMMFEGESLTIHHWADQGLYYDEIFENEYGSGELDDTNKHRFLSVTYDSGRVTLLSDARPLRNRYIGYADHARFLEELVAFSRDGAVIFSNGEGDGLFSLLWLHFRLGMIAMLLFIAFWLWQHLPRFGPDQDIGVGEMREFSSQVRGIGRFLWQHKRDDTMLSAMRASVNRSFSLQSGVSGQVVYEQLSEKSGVPLESVIEAMTRENVHEPSVALRMIQNLQLILKTRTNTER